MPSKGSWTISAVEVTDRRPERRAALAARLDEAHLDGLIVSHLANIRYLTGFTGSSGTLLALRDELVLFSDFRYRTQADDEVEGAARIEIYENDRWQRVWDVLGEYAGVETIGYEEGAVSAETARAIDVADVRPTRKAVRDVVEPIRERKSPEEIAHIREAAALATDALAVTLETIRVGDREQDIAARLEFELRSRGSEWHPFPTIVASGPRSALPHAGTSTRTVEAGDLLLLDFGAQVDGYCADITRTVVVGAQADERQRTIYELVRSAQGAAIRDVKPGMKGREADHIARHIIEQRGFGDAFGHSLGHGLGLEVHEAPRVSRQNDSELPPDAVVTIEPGVYVPGWGGVRIEDDLWLREDGAELLSDGNTELMELV